MAHKQQNRVPAVKKETYKSYLVTAFAGGFALSLPLFILSLSDPPGKHHTLWVRLSVWGGAIVFLTSIFIREYLGRKRKMEVLLSPRYDFLFEHGFTLHEDLFFEGVYEGFHMKIITAMRRRGQIQRFYDAIQIFYDSDPEDDNAKREHDISGTYYLGRLNFSDHTVLFLPKDWADTDFKENLTELIILFERLRVKPISKDDWLETYGIRLKEEAMQKQKERESNWLTKVCKRLGIETLK